MTERKSYVCNTCGRLEEAKGARDWPQVKHHGTVYRFCGDACLQRWSDALPRQLELVPTEREPLARTHDPRAAYGHQRGEP